MAISSTKAKRPRSGAGRRARKSGSRKERVDSYHHGALRKALLEAAERLLDHDGVQALTLRGAARAAGVSHAAPKHHFGDVAGLLSELAVVGFERFRGFLSAGLRDDQSSRERLDAIARGYVAFAKAHPGLFLLMFRSERLDMTRPGLRAAARAALEVLANALGDGQAATTDDHLTLARAGRLAGAWSLVHGFSMLLIDGRWKPLLARLPQGLDADTLFEAVLASEGAESEEKQHRPAASRRAPVP